MTFLKVDDWELNIPIKSEWRWVALKFHTGPGNRITATDIDPDATADIYREGMDYGRCDG